MSTATSSYGDLQAEVLEVLWDRDRALSVTEVSEALTRHPSLAYTTVLTVLVRLFEKGRLRRDKVGRAYVYAPLVTREAFMAQRALTLLSRDGRSPDRGALLAFIDSAHETDPAILDALSELLACRARNGKAE